MNESGFWQSLRKHLKNKAYAWKINANYVGGIPDVWLSGTKEDLWLEIKYMKSVPPVVAAEKLLRPLQKHWLLDRESEGRSVALLIGSSEGHLLLLGTSWEQPISKEKFLQTAKTTKEIAEEILEIIGTKG